MDLVRLHHPGQNLNNAGFKFGSKIVLVFFFSSSGFYIRIISKVLFDKVSTVVFISLSSQCPHY